MTRLKRLNALREAMDGRGKQTLFYRTFLDNVRTWGRVQETPLMMRWFAGMRDPRLPLGFTSLGMRMMRRGKMHGPSRAHKGRLDALFRKIESMEEQ
jgi:heterodisulfide reductase subunit C